ncbi:MAG: copper homeostasis protein CutC [Flavobacteriaceae bacterium]|nr:copper homeostasis protein CutC [Flavobacteriaceae bacterium]|tara:strand:- start:5839 stop:6558 length:720 start_codon:yes stop_codon:yes gene_type:complete
MVKIEICCTSINAALTAQKYGASRIELCSEIFLGGITPSIGLIESCKKDLKIPIRVLLRPRGGDFNYNDKEIKVIINDLIRLKDLGVEGVVIGLSDENGSIPINKLEKILNTIDGKLKLTFHKAFDYLKKPFQDLKTLVEFGFDTILTSGGKKTAEEGINFINKLRNVANGNISIMPGGGINSENFKGFIIHNYEWIHLSAKKQTNLGYKKNTQIPFVEQPIYRIDTDMLQKIKNQNNL